MRPVVLCRFPTAFDLTFRWQHIDHQGQIKLHGSSPEAAEIPTPYPVICLLPAEQIALHQLDIPVKQQQRLIQAVPYALEEQLAADLDDLHFALGSRDRAGNLSVAVVAHDELSAWQSIWQQAGWRIQSACSAIYSVPKPDDGWGIRFDEQQVLVRTAEHQGFAVPTHLLEQTLHLAAQSTTQPLQSLTVYASEDFQDSLMPLQSLGLPVQVDSNPQPCWWQGLQIAQPINLCQGEYQIKSKAGLHWKAWRITAGLLVALLLMYMITVWLDARHLRQQREQLEQQMAELYLQTFPEAQRVVNPRVQMQQRLDSLLNTSNTEGDRNTALQLLNDLGFALDRLQKFTVQRIDFRQQQLEVQIQTSSLQDLETLQQALAQRTVEVEVRSAVSQRQAAEIVLLLRKL